MKKGKIVRLLITVTTLVCFLLAVGAFTPAIADDCQDLWKEYKKLAQKTKTAAKKHKKIVDKIEKDPSVNIGSGKTTSKKLWDLYDQTQKKYKELKKKCPK